MRTVITGRNRDRVLHDAAGRVHESTPNDSFRERLLKYIPVEILALYIAAYGITYYLSGTEDWFPLMARWILIAGVLGTVLYHIGAEGVTDIVQLAISVIGFVLWTFALGVVTVTSLPYYHAVPAAALLAAWVFVSPFIDRIPDRW